MFAHHCNKQEPLPKRTRRYVQEDLYYRLSVYPVELPPLRDRIDDLPLLLDHLIEKFNMQMGRNIHGIADGVLEILEKYHWPGNIRELANAVEHAFVHCRGLFIYPEDLPQSILASPEALLPTKGALRGRNPGPGGKRADPTRAQGGSLEKEPGRQAVGHESIHTVAKDG